MKKLLIGIVCAMALLVFGCEEREEDDYKIYSDITAVVENVGTFKGLSSIKPYPDELQYTNDNLDCFISWGNCYADEDYTEKVTKDKDHITIYVKESDVYLISFKKFPVYLYDSDNRSISTYIVDDSYYRAPRYLISEFTDIADNTHYIKALYTDSKLTKEAKYPIYAEFPSVKLYAEQFECSDKRWFYMAPSDYSNGIYLNEKAEPGTTELIIPVFKDTKTLGYIEGWGITLGSLKTIKIPNWYTSIVRYCFQKNSSLESIDIPASVTRIERHAFNDCPSLKTINYAGTTASFKNDIKFSYSILDNSMYYSDVPLSITEKNEKYKDYKNLSLPTGITVHCTDGDLSF